VALARAIALDPQLMLYDEPFTGLDPISLGVIAHLIKKLNDALGTTSIMVTHDVHKSLDIVDYVYFVSNGEIVADGTPQDIRSSPPLGAPVHVGRSRWSGPFCLSCQHTLQQDLGLKGSQHD
jgi:phospholipid/cholesterol/gamma-HCH transport system ATP-binding protein